MLIELRVSNKWLNPQMRKLHPVQWTVLPAITLVPYSPPTLGHIFERRQLESKGGAVETRSRFVMLRILLAGRVVGADRNPKVSAGPGIGQRRKRAKLSRNYGAPAARPNGWEK
jgi:hypothetical protein